MHTECGLPVRTLPVTEVTHLEYDGPMPALMVYGGQVIYQVRYDEQEQRVGAKRIDNPELALAVTHHLVGLWREADAYTPTDTQVRA
jgi:hypothetical protein